MLYALSSPATAEQQTTLVLRGFTAWNNKARYGGVVDLEYGLLSMSGVLAWNNTAQVGGGVAYCH